VKPCPLPYRLLLAAIAPLLLAAGCGSPAALEEAKAAAESMFDSRIETGGNPDAVRYAEAFWERHSPQEWSSMLRAARTALGRLEGYQLATWTRQDAAAVGFPRATLFALVYETRYERGAGREQLSLLRRPNATRFEILDHRFYSRRIQELLQRGPAKAEETGE